MKNRMIKRLAAAEKSVGKSIEENRINKLVRVMTVSELKEITSDDITTQRCEELLQSAQRRLTRKKSTQTISIA